MSKKIVIGDPVVIGGRTLSLSRAIRAGDFVFLTGQIPFKNGEVMTTGTIEEQTEAVLQTRERMQIATSKNKNSVEAAVAVASRAGDTLHYALSVMKRANYKGYLGAKTPLAEFVRDIVKTTLRVMQSENEQTIGVALSGANQGEPFDICLTDH